MFNPTLCYSIKSKSCPNEQCTNKPKNNELLCGVHLNTKNIIYFNNMHTNTHVTEQIFDNNNIDQNNTSHNMNTDMDTAINTDINKLEIDNDKVIYDKNELYDVISKNKTISVYSLRKSIQKNGLNNIINTKLTKQNLIIELKKIIEKDRFYKSNERLILYIQKIYRGWNVRRRMNCFNDTDILTFDSILDIPINLFYIFNDTMTGKKFGYDIRTLIEILNTDTPTCPYTFRAFTDNEKINIVKYVETLKYNYGINVELDKQEMTPEEEIDMKIKDVFYQINMLDNYTDPSWFKNLSLHQLIELYVKLEDIWHYRAAMPLEARMKILHNGNAFTMSLNVIKKIKSKLAIQHILLNEFTRFITEGVDRDEKKLGAILILSGLVEISYEAANALPHLVQI